MATVVKSMATAGVDGFMVEIEVSTLKGQQQMLSVIGLPDQAIKEAGERIQAAIETCGYDIPKDKVIISLAPGNKKKRGSHFDLGMTIALLFQTDQIAPKNLADYAFIGELALDGRIRPCNGVLSMVTEAKKCGVKAVVVPFENREEASSVSGIRICPVKTLPDTVRFLAGKLDLYKETASEDQIMRTDQSASAGSLAERHGLDFSDVRGQDDLIEAIVLGAAGGHNILMIGEPGCGKTMIAQRIPTILPEMSEKESLEVTKIHSISGLLEAGDGLIRERPFRAPHHNVSLNALIGGGSYAHPGEVSLAHNGVLFLDELPEFSRAALEALRQPLEDGVVSISRIRRQAQYQSSFMLVAAMNPCPCGYFGSSTRVCRCTPNEIRKYLDRISGPLLDRIDLQIEVDAVPVKEINASVLCESSAQVALRVAAARKIQQERYRKEPFFCNAQLSNDAFRRYCTMSPDAEALLSAAVEAMHLSMRAYSRILKTARTVADLDHAEIIASAHVAEAVQYRELDQKYWR